MQHENRFDVIVLGAGIAGLLMASELSKTKRVLVLEQQSAIPHKKYWLTQAQSMVESPELLPGIDRKYAYMDIIANDESRRRITGDFIIWNTAKLLSILEEQIRLGSGQLIMNYKFDNYKVENNVVKVYAGRSQYLCSLLIDCMGMESPIVKAKDVVRLTSRYLVYGATVKLTRPLEPVCLHNTILQKRLRFVEIFPCLHDSAHIALIVPDSLLEIDHAIRDEFSSLIRNSAYSDAIDQHAPVLGELGGFVPVGILRKRALERVFFFGEAALNNPPATGACLEVMLRSYKSISTDLLRRLDNDQLSEKSLSVIPHHPSSFNHHFQRHLFNDILEWNSDYFASVVRKLEEIPDDVILSVLFGDLHKRQIMKYPVLSAALKHRCTFLLGPFLKSIARQD